MTWIFRYFFLLFLAFISVRTASDCIRDFVNAGHCCRCSSRRHSQRGVVLFNFDFGRLPTAAFGCLPPKRTDTLQHVTLGRLSNDGWNAIPAFHLMGEQTKMWISRRDPNNNCVRELEDANKSTSNSLFSFVRLQKVPTIHRRIFYESQIASYPTVNYFRYVCVCMCVCRKTKLCENILLK